VAPPLSVSQALTLAKGALEQVSATIVGEVSEVSDKPGYKAVYFTISDKNAALPCLMWRNVFDRYDVALRQGLLVEVSGAFSLYAAKGRMNFNALSIRLAGEGDLRLKVAQLARKLDAEGLMDAARKRAVPPMPRRVAVVTSPRGKAVHDVLRTLRRRFPMAEVLIAGVPVEGDAAPGALITGIDAAVQAAADVILLVRGGGSYEDLMPFNDEALARAIAASPVPVITGIGHEPDNTIADMVGDFRASTPTAAAEKAVPSAAELSMRLAGAGRAMDAALVNAVAHLSQRVDALRTRAIFSNPLFLLSGYLQALEQTAFRLHRSLPEALVQDRRLLEGLSARMRRVGAGVLEPYRANMRLAAAQLDSLSPLAILARGYAAAYDEEGRVVGSVDTVDYGRPLRVRVSDGFYGCTVDTKQRLLAEDNETEESGHE